MGLQSALHVVFPPQCISCGTLVERDFALCGPCWRETHFISGLVCDGCGIPLPGDDDPAVPVHCDDCMRLGRPWSQGRAALLYQDNARRLVLALKHGDRTALARPAADWMLRAAQPILVPRMLVVPVPLHRLRLLRRKFNQSALLAQRVARRAQLDYLPDLLQRTRRTEVQDGKGVEARFENLSAALAVAPRHAPALVGRHVLLVDDVMTSGATLSAATEACLNAGACDVSTLVLARVAKDG